MLASNITPSTLNSLFLKDKPGMEELDFPLELKLRFGKKKSL